MKQQVTTKIQNESSGW